MFIENTLLEEVKGIEKVLLSLRIGEVGVIDQYPDPGLFQSTVSSLLSI